MTIQLPNPHLPRFGLLVLSKGLVCFHFLHLNFGLLEKLSWNNITQTGAKSTEVGLGRIFQVSSVA